MTTPSPAESGVKKLQDTGIARYVEFPEDTFFMESMAQNAKYKVGVGYVPAQRYVDGREEMHIYTITPSSTEAEHFMGPLEVDGTTDISVFGSALSSTGILYLCAFNRNSIIAVNCDTPENPKAFLEVPNLPSPNDVCLDKDDESILYVAGGTMRQFFHLEFSNSAYGRCYKVQLNEDRTSGESSVLSEDMRTLAGVEKIGDTLWLAELYQCQTLNLKDPSEPRQVSWKGTDPDGQVWMADNVDTFGEDNWMLCPAYSTVPEGTVKNVLSRPFLFSAVLFYFQVSTAFMNGERLSDALEDPEVSLSFSSTYIKEGVDPAPVRLILMKPDQSKSFHFEVDLVETREKNGPREVKDHRTDEVKGKRHYFNEQVTHAGHMVDADGNGFIACINFEQPRILLLDDKPFKEAISEGE